MLLLVIAILAVCWIAVSLLVVSVCVSAADGDSAGWDGAMNLAGAERVPRWRGRHSGPRSARPAA